jgi:hypothetical protein
VKKLSNNSRSAKFFQGGGFKGGFTVHYGYNIGVGRVEDAIAIPGKSENGKINYQLYQTWPENERWELIEGDAYNMNQAAWASSKRSARPAPVPNTEHQNISGEIFGNIWQFLKDKQCRVFSAPFHVRLSEIENPEELDIETVVQPDIVVICDRNKIDKKGCLGAPDIVVEILSLSTGYIRTRLKNLSYTKSMV